MIGGIIIAGAWATDEVSSVEGISVKSQGVGQAAGGLQAWTLDFVNQGLRLMSTQTELDLANKSVERAYRY